MTDEFRDAAHEFGMIGCTGFARALNLTDDMGRPWIVSPEVREQAMHHLTALVGLVGSAELLPNPAYARLQAARNDQAVQSLFKTTSRVRKLRQ